MLLNVIIIGIIIFIIIFITIIIIIIITIIIIIIIIIIFSLTTDFVPLTPSGVTNQQVPPGLLVSVREVHDSLSSLNFGKAIGRDMIPNRLLKDFAPELAPRIMDIYNCSLREGYVPDLLKRSIINPLPKVPPPQEIQYDLRPISLTCTRAKVMEGFARSRLGAQISEKLDPRQYAREGHSTPNALI